MGSIPERGTYSASRCAAILEESPYQTSLEAFQNIMEENQPGWNESKGYTLPVFEESAPIRWGLAFEDAIIKLAEEKFEKNITLREKLFTKKIGDIEISCHLDGVYKTGGGLEEVQEKKDRECILLPSQIIHEGKSTWNRAFYSIKGEDCNDETGEIEFKRRWGEPGTDEVPVEYQIQAAVQRICTSAELVKLSVLVFPKSTQEFEDLGWEITTDKIYKIKDGVASEVTTIYGWAKTFAQIGNFHTYLLPTNKKLESLIIEKIQEFDELYVKPELPPPATNYPDIRRMLTQPQGTIVATPEMIVKARFQVDLPS